MPTIVVKFMIPLCDITWCGIMADLSLKCFTAKQITNYKFKSEFPPVNMERMMEGLALLYIDPTYFVPLMSFHVLPN